MPFEYAFTWRGLNQASRSEKTRKNSRDRVETALLPNLHSSFLIKRSWAEIFNTFLINELPFMILILTSAQALRNTPKKLLV